MAVSSNALTLAQYAIQSNDPMVQAVTYSLIENGSVMADDIPFADKKTLIANGVRWEGNLPSVNWSQLNAEGSVTSGTPSPFQEQAYIIRNEIDVDKFLVEDQNQIVDPRAAQLGAYLKAVSYDFNDKFVNNTVNANANAIVGLRSRLDNTSTYGVRSENKINASAVELSIASMTAVTFNTFLELVDQLLWSVGSPSGAGVTLYLNDVLKRRFARGLRQFAGQGGFSQAQDQFGRPVEMYQQAKIKDIGYKADQTTRIITATETAAGVDGASTHTSMYAVRYGGEDGLIGWQFEAMKAKDLGLLEGGSIYRTHLDWAGGLFPQSNRAMARLYGIKLA